MPCLQDRYITIGIRVVIYYKPKRLIMQTIEIFPNFKKRLILLGLVVILSLMVSLTLPIKSAAFILYMGLCVMAFVYCVARLFNRKAVLILSASGIQSRITINGERMGLISWSDITSIQDSRSLWIIKGIELHASEATVEKYQSRIDKKYRSTRKTLLLYLSNEEINMRHEKLLHLVESYWKKYQYTEKPLAAEER